MSGVAAGQRVGPYELDAVLGKGGMGEVWKGRDTRIDRTVAIKFSRSEFTDRFAREAQAIAALNHPHICTLYDVGPNYLVMEFIEGKPLNGPMPLAEALKVAISIAEALDSAHRKGIVHRDLKPANILITKTGVKLLDFGLAKLSQPSGAVRSDITLTQGLTGQGAILGTLSYMSPEQAEGKDADHRSDIFSFGCVLYEILTGKKAFDGQSPASIIAAILKEQPAPLAAVQPLTPPALDRVIRRCLAKDPDDRWQTVRDLLDELKWIADGGGAGASVQTAEPRKSYTRVLMPVLALLALVATCAALWLWWSAAPREEPRVVRFPLQAVDPLFPSISPDGRHVAYIGGKDRSLWIHDLSQNDPRNLPGTNGAQRPFWAPDSASIAFVLNGELMKMPVAGGPSRSICAMPQRAFFSATWSPDGEWIVFAARGGLGKGGLYRVAARGGVPSLLVADSPDRIHPRDPHFLPLHGRKATLLFTASGTDSKRLIPARAWLYMMATGELRSLKDADGQFPTYSRSGHILYMRMRSGVQLWATPFSLDRLETTGEPFPVANSDFSFGLSANDTLVYVERVPSLRQLTIRDRTGRKVGTVGVPAQDLQRPALSPDGNRVAYVTTEGVVREVWVVAVARPVKTRITYSREDLREFYDDPVWSPAGDKLAYTARAPERYAVRIKPADASGAEVELLVRQTHTQVTDWFRPDRMLLQRIDRASERYWLEFVSIPASPQQEQKPESLLYSEYSGRVSRDGLILAFVSSQSGSSEMHIRGIGETGGGTQVSERSGTHPRWRGDGKELFYVDRTGLMAVPVQRSGQGLQAGKPQLLFTVETMMSTGYDVWPDGQRFLIPEAIEGTTARALRVVQNWNAAFAK